MPIYVYKGGATRIVKGITLRHKGQEIELKSLKGIVNANRLILKKEQPKINKKFAKKLYDLKNVHMIGSPTTAIIEGV